MLHAAKAIKNTKKLLNELHPSQPNLSIRSFSPIDGKIKKLMNKINEKII